MKWELLSLLFFPPNKDIWNPWAGIQCGSKHTPCNIFSRSRQCFYPGKSSPETFSEALLRLKYCLIVLKRGSLVVLCVGGTLLFALTMISIQNCCVCMCAFIVTATTQDEFQTVITILLVVDCILWLFSVVCSNSKWHTFLSLKLDTGSSWIWHFGPV